MFVLLRLPTACCTCCLEVQLSGPLLPFALLAQLLPLLLLLLLP